MSLVAIIVTTCAIGDRRNPLTELQAIHDEINAVSATPWYHGTACRQDFGGFFLGETA